MKKTKNTAAGSVATSKKNNLKKIISDYEANALIAENLVNVINNGDYSSWVKHWHFINNPTELYYSVIDGLVAAFALSMEAVTIKNLFGCEEFANIPAGFYLNFKEIKMLGKRLNKGATGQPMYEKRSFYKTLTKAEEESLMKDEELALAYEILINDPKHPAFNAAFKVTKEDGKSYDFDEFIEWDSWHSCPAYKRHQFVLVYYYNNNDLNEPLDIKTLWNVKDRPQFTPAQKIETAEAVKESYIDRSKVTLYQGLSNSAYYSRNSHSVNLPKMEQFDNTEEYYETMFHEFAHSTGHYTLLNRKSLMEQCGFHSVLYSKEELVAELSSLFILDDLKMMTADVFKNSASYIAGWGANFGKNIKHNVMNTLSHALKAAELVLNKCLKSKKINKEEVIKEEITTNEEVTASSEVATVKVEEKTVSIEEVKPLKNLTAKEMKKRAVSFVNKSKRDYLRKSQYIETMQYITNSAIAVRLVPADWIDEIPEDSNPAVKYEGLINMHFEKDFELATVVNASDVRLAAKNKEEKFTVKLAEEVIYDLSTTQLVGLLNLLRINNNEQFLIARRADDTKGRLALKVKKLIENWNGEKVSEGIICPLYRENKK